MRNFCLSILALSMLLAACGPSAAPVSVPTAPRPAAKATQFTARACTKLLDSAPRTDEPSLFPVVSEQEHVAGPADAAVTIVEYSDFQCVGCPQMAYALAYLLQKYPGQVRLVYRHFPLVKVNDKTMLSAQATEAAHLQGKFWEMHDLLFSKQAEWKDLSPEKFVEWLSEQAASLELETAQFESDLKAPETVKTVEQALQKGQEIGLAGVPLLLINGEIQRPPYILVELETIVRLKMLVVRQFRDCPPIVIDPAKKYTATLKTAQGEVTLRLFAEKAPNTVNNFVFLAQQGWFDNITFHRVVPGFIAQTGDPSGTGLGNPGYFIDNEIDKALQFNRPGMAGMASSGPDINGSQFFITYGAATQLTGVYTIFGQVISGMDVLSRLTARNPQPGEILPDGDILTTVTIEEK